jgi:trimeric autotransporter adhesin
MKKHGYRQSINKIQVVLLLIIGIPFFSWAQNAGINTTNPDSSSILDITSNSKGLLIPRMTTLKRNSIVNPAKSLIVFDSTINAFYFHNGGNWKSLMSEQSGWSVQGNSGLHSQNNFIGTTDATDFNIRVNNRPAGKLSYNKANIFLGINAGHPDHSGDHNIILGDSAMLNDSTNIENIIIGSNAGKNAHCNSSVVIGHNAGQNTTSDNTTLVGYESGKLLTTALGATYLGYKSGTNNTSGSFNTGIGNLALSNVTIGTSNTAIGNGSLENNITGNYNIGIGPYSGRMSTSSIYNICIGYNAGYTNTGSNGNVFIGVDAGRFLTSSTEPNVCVGYYAGRTMTTASNNVLLGKSAGFDITTGSGNLLIGNLAGDNITTGSNNVSLGYLTTHSSTALGNSTTIGYASTVAVSNKVRLGNSAITVVEGQVGYSFPSDGRFKEEIKEDIHGLDFILKLRPVSYRFDRKKYSKYIGEQLTEIEFINLDSLSQNRSIGFIAQEVEKAATETNTTFDGLHKPENEKDTYSISYETFVVPLVKAVQEQQAAIVALQKQVEQLQKQLEAQKK